jgi:hypothetical protein
MIVDLVLSFLRREEDGRIANRGSRLLAGRMG